MSSQDYSWFIFTYLSGFIIDAVMNFCVFRQAKNEQERPYSTWTFWTLIGVSCYLAVLSWVSVMFTMSMMDDIEKSRARKKMAEARQKELNQPKKQKNTSKKIHNTNKF